jgi:uncharacterized protein
MPHEDPYGQRMIWLAVLVLALVAGTIGGIVGFGSSIMLMPALVLAVGPKDAVPILAIAGLMANLSRTAVWWREVNWRVVGAFSATAIPMTALGARTLVALDARAVQLALGMFFLAMIPIRRWLAASGFKVGLRGMALAGAGIGFLSGLVTSVGPINTPFFLAFGLVKGAFVATEAMASLLMGLTRSGVFRSFGLLPWDIAVQGLIVGSALTVGSWLSKQLMLKIDADQFHLLMDALLLIAALVMLLGTL